MDEEEKRNLPMPGVKETWAEFFHLVVIILLIGVVGYGMVGLLGYIVYRIIH